ncbi:hyphally regulated cell wall protein 3 [Drosophila obscura]|uniref:hyphally regulated cell wall protein 3 n=1 Tax=Drosophila obscura TaxID=7282 RepID=UPI001BB29CB8|nr:hyphally regulated cell wall protein 3 [Drosophila obscura]
MSTAKVFVGSLPSGCKPDELRRLFANYGVVEADVMNRCGFVHLETSDMADAAIAALNGTLFKGVSIVVEAGRPKERSRNGAGSRVPPSVGGGSGRRSLEGQSGASNHRRDGGGSAGGRYGSEGGFKSNGNQFGPIRNETNFRQQRNAPYSKGPPQQTSNESPQGYRNKFSVGSNGGRNGDGGRFSSNRFQHRDNNDGAGSSSANRGASQGQRRNIKNSPSNNNNDFLAGNSSFNNPRGGTGVRQDRRGFALPVEQQQMTFGVQQNRFRNGSSSGNRNSSGVNGADPQGRRGSYNERGGFNARRGAANNEHNRPQRPGGASNKPGAVDRHDQSGLHASYQTEFPPLGRQERRPWGRGSSSKPFQRAQTGTK